MHYSMVFISMFTDSIGIAFDCSGNSIRYKIVVALLLMLEIPNWTTSVGPKLCGISFINAVRLSRGNMFLYYRYQAE